MKGVTNLTSMVYTKSGMKVLELLRIPMLTLMAVPITQGAQSTDLNNAAAKKASTTGTRMLQVLDRHRTHTIPFWPCLPLVTTRVMAPSTI